MNQSILKIFVAAVIIIAGTVKSNCQDGLPDVFNEGTIPEQMDYLNEHTRIYENFRAIREDMFRTLRKNTMDTLSKNKSRINGLIIHTASLNSHIDSLNKTLEAANSELDKMTRTKYSINVLGIEVDKKTYNSVMWSILGILVLLLVIGYLSFKQNRAITLRTKKDLNELKEEFEAYHQKTRLERERMTIDHFNEIKKLKGR